MGFTKLNLRIIVKPEFGDGGGDVKKWPWFVKRFEVAVLNCRRFIYLTTVVSSLCCMAYLAGWIMTLKGCDNAALAEISRHIWRVWVGPVRIWTTFVAVSTQILSYLSCRKSQENQKNSVSVIDNRVKIRTGNFPNTNAGLGVFFRLHMKVY